MSRKGDIHVEKCVDRDFVWELCKRGDVLLFTSQVEVIGQSLDLAGLKLPPGCEVEHIGAYPSNQGEYPIVKVTFGFREVKVT